jgi:hypothetical protein
VNKTARSKKQVRADRKALKTLRQTGLYGGKVDLRKAPTAYQSRLIAKHADVISGHASVVIPKTPSAYKGHFVIGRGGRVIVPRAPGERIGLSRTGRIERVGKTRTGKRKRTIIPLEKPERGLPRPLPGMALVYYLPFRRGSGKGQVTQWMRYSHSGLVRFFAEYDLNPERASDWLRHVEIEEMPEAYERELDRFISGEATGEPEAPLPHASAKYRRGKRALRRSIFESEGEAGE